MKWATPQQLISNTLFDQGYGRWRVVIHVNARASEYVVWARDATDIEDYYIGRGADLIEIKALPLARFVASVKGERQVMGKQGWETVKDYAGDVILSDEFLQAHEQARGERYGEQAG